MSFDPAAALVTYHAALDAHDVDRVETLMAGHATYRSDGIGLVEGRDAIVAAMKAYFAAQTEHQAWDDTVVATGPRSARAEWQLTATQPNGDVIKRSGTEDVTFDADGLVLSVVVVDLT